MSSGTTDVKLEKRYLIIKLEAIASIQLEAIASIQPEVRLIWD